MIKDVRGRGLMIAVEFHKEAGGGRRYCQALKEVGLLCKDTHENTIRFTPLVITQAQVDWAPSASIRSSPQTKPNHRDALTVSVYRYWPLRFLRIYASSSGSPSTNGDSGFCRRNEDRQPALIEVRTPSRTVPACVFFHALKEAK